MQDDWRGFTVKVSDFGLSRLLPESHVQIEDKLATDDVAGTVTHMAPELLSGDSMSAAADVYAFGILSKSILGLTCCEWHVLYSLSHNLLRGISQVLLVTLVLVIAADATRADAHAAHSAESGQVLTFHLFVVYELWSGQIAFPGLSKIQVMAGVVNSGLRPSFPRNCPTWYSTLAVTCWAQSPAAR